VQRKRRGDGRNELEFGEDQAELFEQPAAHPTHLTTERE
jgi:hypothetical protein